MPTSPEPPKTWPTVDAEERNKPRPPGSSASCTSCGAEAMEDGFLEDGGESSRGYVRWIVGPLERGIFGGARRFGKVRLIVNGKRCAKCGHLELFATERP